MDETPEGFITVTHPELGSTAVLSIAAYESWGIAAGWQPASDPAPTDHANEPTDSTDPAGDPADTDSAPEA